MPTLSPGNGAVQPGVERHTDAFAARLGMTARHLNRLFARHWGASPSVVAKTARVQRAKRLLDETSLPMVDVALQAGFGSLRRFNAVFLEVYKRPPSALRRPQRMSRCWGPIVRAGTG